MEFVVVGAPGAGTTLRLDYRAFAYAGKFVVGTTGKAVLHTGDGSAAAPDWTPDRPLPASVDPETFERDVLAAVAFSPDRTDPDRCRLRYVTVHAARRGDGLGPRLLSRTTAWLASAGYERVRIAVNNPFAYEAVYKCGFAFTGETTGLAELELERPTDQPAPAHGDGERYRSGLAAFREHDTDRTSAERRFLAARIGEPDDETETASDEGGSTRTPPAGPPDVVEVD